MSSRDYEINQKFLPPLKGRKSFVTLATNSIKLHIDDDGKSGTYLWIDPPWVFGDDGKMIESSETCPDYSEPEYKARFKMWGEKFAPVFENFIADIDASPNGRLSIVFADGYRLIVPAVNSDTQEKSWYDHWYYSEKR